MDYLPDLTMIPVRSGTRQGGGSVSVVENLVLGMVDGARTVAQLAEVCGVDNPLAQRILSRLIATGLVQIRPSTTVSEGAADAVGDKFVEEGVHDFYKSLEKMNYYEMLGVNPTAERTTIRNAYFALSKKYHPDTHFGGDDPQHKQELSRIFDRLTIAYETLSGKSKRQQYDETIADQIEMWKLEHQLKQAVEQKQSSLPPAQSDDVFSSASVRTSRPGVRAAVPSSSSGESNPSETVRSGSQSSGSARASYRRVPVQDSVSVGVGARISRIPATRSSYTTQLQGEESPSPSRTSTQPTVRSSSSGASWPARTSTAPSGASGSMTPEEREQRRQKWKRERLKKALGATNIAPSVPKSASTTTTQSDDRLLEHARIALEHHEYDHAVQYLQEVLRRDGENSAASMLLQRAQSGRVKTQINELIRQGRFEQSRGNVNNALELYERALKLDNRHIEAMHHVAGALLETGTEVSRALQLSRDVVSRGGNKASYFAVMAELLAIKGEMGKAIDIMQKAVDLAPENKEYRKRLKVMKK